MKPLQEVQAILGLPDDAPIMAELRQILEPKEKETGPADEEPAADEADVDDGTELLLHEAVEIVNRHEGRPDEKYAMMLDAFKLGFEKGCAYERKA